MKIIAFILNLPYTIIGLVLALLSGPRSIRWNKEPYAFVFDVENFWWMIGYMKNGRAVAIGHIILLGPALLPKDLEHELIHVEQYSRAPVIHPILYYTELLRKGYRNNKYEDEAYRRAGNVYIDRK